MVLPQDLCVALQALLLICAADALLARFFARRKLLPLSVLATVAFVVVHFYMLFDFLLYRKTAIRMDADFLGFLPAATSFASSAVELGLGGLAVGVAVGLLCLAVAFRFFRQTVSRLEFSVKVLVAVPLVAVLATASRQVLPAELAYAVNNLVFTDESRLFSRWFDRGSRLGASERSEALKLATPRSEEFERVLPGYPLLKRTTGFTGTKQFDVSVEPGERPHVILLFLESFRAADVGVLGGSYATSPNFDRLASEGILFTNFYANGVQTTRAVMASLFGILPCFSAKSPHYANPNLPLVGLPDLFNDQGYLSAYITGASLQFEGGNRFFPAQGYSVALGEEQLAGVLQGAKRTSWGYHDEYLLDYVADWLEEQDRRSQPCFLTVFTISHHHPWHVPDHYPAPQFDTGSSGEYRRFLQTFHYADHCLGKFVANLRRMALDRRTILFILADTAAPQGEHHDNFMLINYLYEENLRIPLLILAPGRIREPKMIHDVGSQVDLLPTVMDMLGIKGLNHAIGTSLMRCVDERAAYFNNPFALKYIGMRQGRYKCICNVASQTASLYDLARDPGERSNLAPGLPELTNGYQRATHTLHQLMAELYLSERFAPRSLDIRGE
jgi:phosphoglycerol transferase MdoB-like AlkP superfamily enzyme